MRKNLKESILLIQKDIRMKIRNINRGGCVYFAKFLSEELIRLGIKHRIVVCGRNDKHIKDSLENEYSFAHVMIYIHKMGYIDGEELYLQKKDLWKGYYPKSLKLEQINLDKHIRNGCWNPTYNRYSNGRLKKIIQRHLNDYRG
jgi:hypothetical protein